MTPAQIRIAKIRLSSICSFFLPSNLKFARDEKFQFSDEVFYDFDSFD